MLINDLIQLLTSLIHGKSWNMTGSQRKIQKLLYCTQKSVENDEYRFESMIIHTNKVFFLNSFSSWKKKENFIRLLMN